METKEFKRSFSEIAIRNGFTNEFNALFKESDDCLIALMLRRSNFSKLFYLRIKIKLKSPGQILQEKKDWVKHDVADILLGVDEKYSRFFDLENQISDTERINEIHKLFDTHLTELIKKALTREGLLELNNTGKIFLLPAAKSKLGIN